MHELLAGVPGYWTRWIRLRKSKTRSYRAIKEMHRCAAASVTQEACDQFVAEYDCAVARWTNIHDARDPGGPPTTSTATFHYNIVSDRRLCATPAGSLEPIVLTWGMATLTVESCPLWCLLLSPRSLAYIDDCNATCYTPPGVGV